MQTERRLLSLVSLLCVFCAATAIETSEYLLAASDRRIETPPREETGLLEPASHRNYVVQKPKDIKEV